MDAVSESLWESIFGPSNDDTIFDAVHIKCPCGARFKVAAGLSEKSFAGATEKFIEAHRDHGVVKEKSNGSV